MKKIAFIIWISVVIGCASDDSTADPVFCTTEAVAGLQITVLDGSGGEPLTEGVIVIAQDGEYQETLMNAPGSISFSGAIERSGNYAITITKEGYQSIVDEVIVVQEDICHVITENKEFILTKL